jgi:hypothetical protein
VLRGDHAQVSTWTVDYYHFETLLSSKIYLDEGFASFVVFRLASVHYGLTTSAARNRTGLLSKLKRMSCHCPSWLAHADFGCIENLRVLVTLLDGHLMEVVEVLEIDPMKFSMLIKSSVSKKKRPRWTKFLWFVYPVITEPLGDTTKARGNLTQPPGGTHFDCAVQALRPFFHAKARLLSAAMPTLCCSTTVNATLSQPKHSIRTGISRCSKATK